MGIAYAIPILEFCVLICKKGEGLSFFHTFVI